MGLEGLFYLPSIMAESLIWFLASWATGAAGVGLARSLALRQGWLDLPNERSFHTNPTPRIGGFGFLAPVVLGLLALWVWPGRDPGSGAVLWLAPCFLVAFLSFLDDRFNIPRILRFGVHAVCAVLVLWLFREVWMEQPLPLVGLLPVTAAAVLLFLWIAGLTNAYNFMDGIDGIAAIQGLVALVGWFLFLALEPGLEGPGIRGALPVLLLLAGGLAGFLLFNWSPARIFMGDVGSTFLGFFLAVVPFAAASAGASFPRALEAGAFFVWPFVADASLTFLRRLARREAVFEAHRSHLYQRLAGSFTTRETGHQVASVVFGAMAVLGILMFWFPAPLFLKLACMAGIWFLVSHLGRRLRSEKTEIDPISGSTGRGPAENMPISVNSGLPHMSFDIFLNPPEVSEAERRLVMEALESGYIAPVGPQVNRFEKELTRILGLEEMQAVVSGTAAIHLSLKALGVGPGDCVLCPDLTFIASVNPVRYLGAEPVLVDVDPANWAIDIEASREAIHALRREGRRVGALVVVHAFGIPAPMEAIMAMASEEAVPVLEDCAGAFGSRIGDISVGHFGDAAAFSFNGNKVVTTSGGGALYLKDPALRPATRRWANQGKQPGAMGYVHHEVGFNYKLSNICAAVGLGQLESAERRLARKQAIAAAYRKGLAESGAFTFMPEPPYGKNNYWLNCVGLAGAELGEELVKALHAERIEAAPMWRPMRQQEVNTDLRHFGGSASDRIYRDFLSLPSGPTLTDGQVQRICTLIQKSALVLKG